MNEKEAFKIVNKFMQKYYPFAKGKDWDKENGNLHFILGIYSVLDYIEALADDDIDIEKYEKAYNKYLNKEAHKYRKYREKNNVLLNKV